MCNALVYHIDSTTLLSHSHMPLAPSNAVRKSAAKENVFSTCWNSCSSMSDWLSVAEDQPLQSFCHRVGRLESEDVIWPVNDW